MLARRHGHALGRGLGAAVSLLIYSALFVCIVLSFDFLKTQHALVTWGGWSAATASVFLRNCTLPSENTKFKTPPTSQLDLSLSTPNLALQTMSQNMTQPSNLEADEPVMGDETETASGVRAGAIEFTPINSNEEGEPRRLKHVSCDVMRALTAPVEDDGPEPGFGNRPHGTDFTTGTAHGNHFLVTCTHAPQLIHCRPRRRG